MSNVTTEKDKAMQIGVIAVSHNYTITQKIKLCGLLYKFSKIRKTIKTYTKKVARIRTKERNENLILTFKHSTVYIFDALRINSTQGIGMCTLHCKHTDRVVWNKGSWE